MITCCKHALKYQKNHILTISNSSSFTIANVNLSVTSFLGTGVPLSIFCHSYYSCLFFILFLNPSICFFGAINKARIEYKKENSPTIDVFITNLVKFYKTHLLHPDDWFSLWRLNCRLVSYHSHITKAKGYLQEVQYCIILKYLILS